MKRKILQFILKRLKNSNYTSFKECYECAVKRGSPQLCEQCYWVRENYKPNRIIFMNQQEERWLRFIEHKPNIRLLPDSEYNDLKSFLQSEINLALSNRDKEIVEMIDENIKTVNEFTGDGFVTKDMKSFALVALKDLKIALINLTKAIKE